MNRRTVIKSSVAALGLLTIGYAGIGWLAADEGPTWRPDHFASSGEWESLCDYREVDGVRQERCYLRLMDIYSQRPDFGAYIGFITIENGGRELKSVLSFEREMDFTGDGFSVVEGEQTVWKLNTGWGLFSEYTLGHDDTSKFIAAMSSEGADLKTTFDRNDKAWNRVLDGNGFREAYADFMEQAKLRGLYRGEDVS